MIAVAVKYADLLGVISTEQVLTTTTFSRKGHVMARRIIVAPPPTDKRFIDLTGRVFGQITVLAHCGHYFLEHRGRAFKKQLWKCRCSCGAEIIRESGVLLCGERNGRDQSCNGPQHAPVKKILQAGMRQCSKCKRDLTLEHFQFRRGGPVEACKECLAARRKEFYAGPGRERLKAYQGRPDIKERDKSNRKKYIASDHGKAKLAAYYAQPSRKKAISNYKRRPAGKLRNALHKQNRRAKEIGLLSNFTRSDMRAASLYWNSACAVCSTPLGLIAKTHWDHWIPLSNADCPGTIPQNMVPLCESCNVSKGANDAKQWAIGKFGSRGKTIVRKVESFLRQTRTVIA